MGTSASNSGPNDKTPLLPAWAQGGPGPAPDEPSPPPPAPDGQDPAAQPSPVLLTPKDSDPPPTADGNLAQPRAARGAWSLARRAMSSVATGGGGLRRMRVAGRRYVAAKGGATTAAKSSAAGGATTAGLGSFLSNVASAGFAEAARSLGLQSVVGQKAGTVLAAVIDAIAPSGTTNDQAIARRAASETLRQLFEQYGVEQTGVEALNAMTAADVAETVELSVSAYVYQRWLFDLSLKIEEHAVSEAEAVRLERDVKTFVKGLVKLKLNGTKALDLDWKGAAGKAFTQEIYEAAYRLLGGNT